MADKPRWIHHCSGCIHLTTVRELEGMALPEQNHYDLYHCNCQPNQPYLVSRHVDMSDHESTGEWDIEMDSYGRCPCCSCKKAAAIAYGLGLIPKTLADVAASKKVVS